MAVKKALKAWRHWIEGSKHPFPVWTDHRNLEHIRAAKRLNLRQARWALFFARFHFTISYRPGSKNMKADALSPLYDTEERQGEETNILPPCCIIAPVVWDVDANIYSMPCVRNPHMHSVCRTAPTFPQVCGTASFPGRTRRLCRVILG